MTHIEYIEDPLQKEYKVTATGDWEDIACGLARIIAEVVADSNDDGDDANISLALLLHCLHEGAQGLLDDQYETILA